MHTQVITSLRNHSDKVRIVLNKSDQIDQQQLMRVYGALMWSLGKVFKSPEVSKVYVGSFNCDAPIREVCYRGDGGRGGQVWGWGAWCSRAPRCSRCTSACSTATRRFVRCVLKSGESGRAVPSVGEVGV